MNGAALGVWGWLLALAVAPALVGCGERAPDASAADVHVFRRAIYPPESLDPANIVSENGAAVALDTFEGLYRFGPTHETLAPAAAERVDVSDDAKTYIFRLRRGLEWSDGRAVTAGDFEYSWKRVFDPRTACQYAGTFFVIKGAREFNAARPDEAERLRDAVGVHALDDRTLQVELVTPVPYFTQLTAYFTLLPVRRDVVERFGPEWTRPEHVVSNGPWVLKSVDAGQITVERNPRYYDRDAIPFDRVVYRISEEQAPFYRMYEANGLDFLERRIPENLIPSLAERRTPDLHVTDFLGVYSYVFNTTKPPFSDGRVRRAFDLAVNKSDIGAFVTKGGERPADGLVPPGFEFLGYRRAVRPPFDPKAARRALADAGFPDARGFPQVRLTYPNQERHRLIAEYAHEQWARTLGIDVELEGLETRSFLDRLNRRDFQIARSGWYADFADPVTFLAGYDSRDTNNQAGWKSDRFDALLAKASAERDRDRRSALLSEAEALLLAEAPVMPLFFVRQYDLVKPGVQGYQPHALGFHLSRYFRK